ncbi:MAG: hypothetical protein U9N81_13670, partial [Bacillota bacterium]|nr:hypothetical protein [Bacillota bacterium]
MLGDITSHEIELLIAINTLNQSMQKDLEDYLKYLLCKQYKREMMVTIFHNQLLQSLLQSLLHLIERDDYEFEQVEKRMKQINEIYFGLFEQVHQKYSEVVPDLDTYDLVKE